MWRLGVGFGLGVTTITSWSRLLLMFSARSKPKLVLAPSFEASWAKASFVSFFSKFHKGLRQKSVPNYPFVGPDSKSGSAVLQLHGWDAWALAQCGGLTTLARLARLARLAGLAGLAERAGLAAGDLSDLGWIAFPGWPGLALAAPSTQTYEKSMKKYGKNSGSPVSTF